MGCGKKKGKTDNRICVPRFVSGGWGVGVLLVYGGGGDSWKKFSALAGSKVGNVLASLKNRIELRSQSKVRQ